MTDLSYALQAIKFAVYRPMGIELVNSKRPGYVHQIRWILGIEDQTGMTLSSSMAVIGLEEDDFVLEGCVRKD